MARPSKYTPEIGQEICDLMIAGQSIRSICQSDKFPSATTVFNWLATRGHRFLEQYTHAREIQAEMMADEILDIADDGTNDFVERETKKGAIILCDQEHINRSRLRVDARKWVASKLLPKKYGEKLELSGDPERPLKLTIEHIGKRDSRPSDQATA